MRRHSTPQLSNISTNYPSNVDEGFFVKDLDLSVIEGHPRYEEWKKDIHTILDNEFPKQSYESEEVCLLSFFKSFLIVLCF